MSVSLTTCRSATMITITIVTDVDCARRPSSLVSIGELHEMEDKPGSASSSTCDAASFPHRVGTLVITPSGANDQEVAFKVVESIGQTPESCAGRGYKDCIVARRSLRFIPHSNVDITLSMLLSCKDIPCGESQTCVRGNCETAMCDAATGGCSDVATADAGAIDGGGDGGGEGGDGATIANGCMGKAGPKAVRFDVPNASYSFCVDSTEVTNEEFNVFAANPGPLALPAECSQAVDGGLPAAHTDSSRLHRPMTQVSFCDAWAYCSWAGKRLCGKIGGGRAENTSNASNEWVYACSNGTGSAYPYGPTYDAGVCNTEADAAAGLDVLRDVDANPACHGMGPGFGELLDMSGNAGEIDSYVEFVDDAGAALVEARGGGATAGANAQCGSVGTFGQYTRAAADDVGFRCCADVAR